MTRLALTVLAMALFCGCSDVEYASKAAYGNKHRVEMYSGGVLVNTWTSTGVVENEEGSDGFKFVSEATGQLKRVSGDLVITTLDE